MEVPPVGFAATFTTGHHAAGQKRYTFTDRRGRNLALISDSLPAALRLAHLRGLPEQRITYCCPIFRYERRPRRHFHHLGVMEVAKHAAGLIDHQRSTTRLARLVADFLAPRVPVHFTLTDPGLWRSLVGRFLPAEQGTVLLHQLSRTPHDQRPALLHAAGAPPDAVRLAEHLATDPSLSTGCTAASGNRIETAEERASGCATLAETLGKAGACVTVDLRELHASEFHDGPAFLIRSSHEERLLGDGGTYGGFAHAFLGTQTSAYSAVLGLERLADLIRPPNPHPVRIAVLAKPHPDAVAAADRLSAELRAAGISVWDAVLSRPLRHQLRSLAAHHIPYSILLGPREALREELTVRSLDGALQVLPRRDVIAWLLQQGRCTDRALGV